VSTDYLNAAIITLLISLWSILSLSNFYFFYLTSLCRCN
jgi:hypothetical protein